MMRNLPLKSFTLSFAVSFTARKKILKENGSEPSEFEESVAQASILK